MSDRTERVEAQISGRVQGVGFRHFTTQQARRLGVDGWVRNESNGTVRVVAEGPHDALEQFLERLREGPAGAHVLGVHTNWMTASGKLAGFSTRYF